jgi:hypothetical protein
MRGITEKRRPQLAACLLASALAAGCGGGERQDASEEEGSYRVEVVSASFPSEQRLAGRATMKVAVRNVDSKAVPNVAMTVKTGARTPGGAPTAFGQSVDDPRLAEDERPVWIVDKGPDGGTTAYTNTWALGRLSPGQTKTFEWQVTPVEAGRYTVSYEAAPGLAGRARLASGSKASGRFRVAIDDAPQDASVGPDGEVIRK